MELQSIVCVVTTGLYFLLCIHVYFFKYQYLPLCKSIPPYCEWVVWVVYSALCITNPLKNSKLIHNHQSMSELYYKQFALMYLCMTGKRSIYHTSCLFNILQSDNWYFVVTQISFLIYITNILWITVNFTWMS